MGEQVTQAARRGQVFIVSAPAGAGKTTLVKLLMAEFSSIIASISYTTRAPRGPEVDEVDYYFVDEEDFCRRIAAGEFLEYVRLYDDYYGTSRVWVEKKLAEGKHVILVIDTQGAQQLKGKIDAASIFIAPPSLEVLEHRLRQRNTESPVAIEKRLAWARREMEAIHTYDYLIVNDDLYVAYQALRSIVIAEEHRIR